MKKCNLLFILILILFFGCPPKPEIIKLPNENQLNPPEIAGNLPIVTFGDKVEFVCGETITPAVILQKLKDPSIMSITSENENVSKEFTVTVKSFTIPKNFHGFFDIDFTVADSKGSSVDKKLTICIKENLVPAASITLNYTGKVVEFPYGVAIATNLENVLKTENSGLSVTNSNSCSDSKRYEIVDAVYPADVSGFKFFMTAGEYSDVKFKVKDSLGVASNEVTITLRIMANTIPPVVTPPATTLDKAVGDAVSDADLFTYLKTGTITSNDPNVKWDNSTFSRLTVVDSSKQGVQKIFFKVLDLNSNESLIKFLRVKFVGTPTFVNILQDPGFEGAPANLTGTVTNPAYTNARLSGAWTITPTKLALRYNSGEGGSQANKTLADWIISATGNSADLAQGPFILNTAYSGFNSATPKTDNGYKDKIGVNYMGDLTALTTLNNMLVYRATEKKKTGTYSIALRGKTYSPAAKWMFYGVGCAISQNITLKADTEYKFSAEIIKSFGWNESGNLDGMVGSIYISVRKVGETTPIKELHIFGHPASASYGSFLNIAGTSFTVSENTDAVFEIRRYLSNDSGQKDETNSTWGYSPIYIDDCRLDEMAYPNSHLPEDEQVYTP